METLPARQQQVLRATVHHYVDTMEPVGSKALVRRFRLKASSSTVRSDMGALENKGFLKQKLIKTSVLINSTICKSRGFYLRTKKCSKTEEKDEKRLLIGRGRTRTRAL